MTRVRIAEFGIIQKPLANAVVTFFLTDSEGVNSGVKAVVYQAATGSTTTENPQTLDENGMLRQDCYIDAAIMATITGISSLAERQIKKIKQSPLDFQLPVTSANIATESAIALYGDLSEVQAAVAAVEAILADPGFIAVAGDLLGADNIGTVGANIASVNTVAGNTTNINTVAAANTAIGTVATNIAAVSAVGTNIAAVVAVNANATNINAVNANSTNINIVAAANTAINTVATGIAAVNTVSAAIAAVNTTATNIASVNTVAANIAAVVIAALDLAGSDTIGTVATNIASVNTVAGIAAAVSTVAANMATITDAAANIPKANRTAITDPTTGDDSADGYSEASIWVNTVSNQVFFCGDPALGAAIWVNVTAAGTFASLSDVTLTSVATGDMLRYSGSAWVNRTAAQTRTDLGLVIGTNVQAYDAELAAFAGLTSAADKLGYFTGSATMATTDFTSFSRTLLDDADAATMRTTLGLTIGTNVQAYDADLAAIAGLTSAANKGITFTGSGTAATYDLSAFALTFLDDADATAVRSTLGLVIGTNVQAYDAELAALAGLTSAANAVPVFTGSATAGLVTLTASTLLGMGSSGNAAPISLGTGLSMSGTTLSASSVDTNFGALGTSNYVSGRKYNGCLITDAGQSLTPAANNMYGGKVYFGDTVTFTKMSINVQTAEAGKSARVGLYSMTNGVPAALFVDAGAVSIATTGVKEITGLTVNIVPGWYVPVIITDSTTAIVSAQPTALQSAWAFGQDADWSVITRFKVAQAYGALPGTFGTATLENANAPLMGFRL